MDGMSPPSNRTGFRRDTTTTAHRPGSRQSNGSRLRTGRPGERSRAVTHDSPNVSGHRTSDRPSPAGAVVSSRLSGSVGNLRPRARPATPGDKLADGHYCVTLSGPVQMNVHGKDAQTGSAARSTAAGTRRHPSGWPPMGTAHRQQTLAVAKWLVRMVRRPEQE